MVSAVHFWFGDFFAQPYSPKVFTIQTKYKRNTTILFHVIGSFLILKECDESWGIESMTTTRDINIFQSFQSFEAVLEVGRTGFCHFEAH